jgi:hypothetical protein
MKTNQVLLVGHKSEVSEIFAFFLKKAGFFPIITDFDNAPSLAKKSFLGQIVNLDAAGSLTKEYLHRMFNSDLDLPTVLWSGVANDILYQSDYFVVIPKLCDVDVVVDIFTQWRSSFMTRTMDEHSEIIYEGKV